MIDVVFQLMIFFMLTFNIIAPEGDFDVRMPLGKSSAEPPDDLQLPPIQVRLAADDEGTRQSEKGSPEGGGSNDIYLTPPPHPGSEGCHGGMRRAHA